MKKRVFKGNPYKDIVKFLVLEKKGVTDKGVPFLETHLTNKKRYGKRNLDPKWRNRGK